MRIQVIAGQSRLLSETKIPRSLRKQVMARVATIENSLQDSKLDPVIIEMAGIQVTGLLDAVEIIVDQRGETLIQFKLLTAP